MDTWDTVSIYKKRTYKYMEQAKHYFVNWVDGMKLSKKNFRSLEETFQYRLQDALQTHTTNYNFGLLKRIGLDATASLKIIEYNDYIELLECSGVTRGGIRIEFSSTQYVAPLTCSLKDLVSTVKNETIYDLFVRVDPFSRLPVGEPDPTESPLRQVYAIMSYELVLVPESETLKSQLNKYQLLVGKIKIGKGKAERLKTYIPPSTSMSSYPILQNAFTAYHSTADKILARAAKVAKKVNSGTPDTRNDNFKALAQTVYVYLSNTIDRFRLRYQQEPPLLTVEFCIAFARNIDTFLKSMEQISKETLLEYIESWVGRDFTPAAIEKLLADMIELQYDHLDMYPAISLTMTFMVKMETIFDKLAEQDFGIRKAPPPPTPSLEELIIISGGEGGTTKEKV